MIVVVRSQTTQRAEKATTDIISLALAHWFSDCIWHALIQMQKRNFTPTKQVFLINWQTIKMSLEWSFFVK